MAHVVLKDLVKTYGNFKAVNEVSLTVNDGEFVALVGPSGCGKTTTLNLVAGLTPITSGDIVIGDRVVNDLDPKDRDIAMVFQNYALYPQKSVYMNLAFPLQMRKLPRDEIDKKVKEAARVLDMTHLLERKPRELSGGERQRVALARVLVRDRPVLLLDEPFASLGPALRDDMLDLVAGLHAERGMTVLFVTHQPQDARRIGQKVVFLDNGAVAATGTADDFFAGAGPEAFRRYIGAGAGDALSRDIARKRT
ncbi:MAG: ABC transporter ATP-binding protein [Mesorhizobium sp.]|nr:MAG: ABC transporter ATP-binding protein [Mesorhizobium sp.]